MISRILLSNGAHATWIQGLELTNMYKGKARAYTNIALIKYWGKENETLILPMNNSLSLTLDAFYTETSVTFSEEYTQDRFSWMTNSRVRLQRRKSPLFGSCTRKSQLSFFAQVNSRNFVPTAAGLASSASGLAALAGACNAALDLQLSQTELSRLARRGSGSACRSILAALSNGILVMMTRLTQHRLLRKAGKKS